MRTVLLLFLASCSQPPAPLDVRTDAAPRMLGTFDFRGSRCELMEVNQQECERCEWKPAARFTVCVPPVVGMCAASMTPKDEWVVVPFL